MQKTSKPTTPKYGNWRDVLAVMGIGFAWSGLLIALVFLFYILQSVLGIGQRYVYVPAMGADGEAMWRADPSLDFAMAAGILFVLPLLYWKIKRKNEIRAGAFSLRLLRPYVKAIALVCLCYAGRGLIHAMNGDLRQSMGEGIGGFLPSAAGTVLAALFGMLLMDGRTIGCLRGKGRSDEEIVRAIAQETLLLDIVVALLRVADAYMRGEAVGAVGAEDVLSLLAGVAYAVLCSRLYLSSGSMMGRGILACTAGLFTADAAQYSLWLFAADAILLIALCAASAALKEKTGRCENGLT